MGAVGAEAIEQRVAAVYGLADVRCERLDTPVNDVVRVRSRRGDFALKLYSRRARTVDEVRWELDLVEHLRRHMAPVAQVVPGRHGLLETFQVDGRERPAALFAWAPGEKPGPAPDTYRLLGTAAARIHAAADSFRPTWLRDDYDVAVLIDEQLRRMRPHLVQAGRWRPAVELGDRLRRWTDDPHLDRGVCHMDLTLDNVHREDAALTVFDFDSSGRCWRAVEPAGVLRTSRACFDAWLEGYRSVRSFGPADERAVAAFAIIAELRVVAWKLGAARSSRGTPLLTATDLPRVVDEWLAWEARHLGST